MSITSSPLSRSPVRKRLDFLDMLRGVGLLFMVFDHAYDWWLSEPENQGRWGTTTEFIGNLAAPIFLVLVGVSMSLATDTRQTRNVPAKQAAWLLVRRGLLVCLWGYAVNLLVFFEGDNWADLFAFDVLQCIGAGMVLFAPLVVWGPTWIFPLLAAIIGWGGQFADAIDLPGYLGTMINGLPPISYFPLVPWLCFVPLGISLGRALTVSRDDRTKTGRLIIGLGLSGLPALVGAAFVPSSVGYRHPRLVSILFEWTVVALLGSGLYALCRSSLGRRALRWLRDMGREALLLYVLHHLVGFRLFRYFGWVNGRSWRDQFGALHIREATLLLFGLLALMNLATWGWTALKRENLTFKSAADILL
jgi:uncharacterized membrane protein